MNVCVPMYIEGGLRGLGPSEYMELEPPKNEFWVVEGSPHGIGVRTKNRPNGLGLERVT